MSERIVPAIPPGAQGHGTNSTKFPYTFNPHWDVQGATIFGERRGQRGLDFCGLGVRSDNRSAVHSSKEMLEMG